MLRPESKTTGSHEQTNWLVGWISPVSILPVNCSWVQNMGEVGSRCSAHENDNNNNNNSAMMMIWVCILDRNKILIIIKTPNFYCQNKNLTKEAPEYNNAWWNVCETMQPSRFAVRVRCCFHFQVTKLITSSWWQKNITFSG